MLRADCFLEARHLYRCQRRLESLVTHLEPGAVDGLLERIAGKHAEGVRHSRFLRRLADATRYFVHDDVVVRRIAAQQAAEANDGVVSACFGEGARGGRDFEGAGNPDDLDISLSRSGAKQPIVCAMQKPLGYERIEP